MFLECQKQFCRKCAYQFVTPEENKRSYFNPLYVKAPIHYQTQSHDPIGCYGNSGERTSKTAYRILEFLPRRTTEPISGSRPLKI